MKKPSIPQVLNRLLTTQHRSLPMYLTSASPWIHRGDEEALAALHHIVADQQALSRRIAEYLLDHHWRVEPGEFPIEWTSLHDCSVDYLIGRVLQEQRRAIAIIESCVADLHGDPAARALAEEVLGAARAHLESLEELGQDCAKAALPTSAA